MKEEVLIKVFWNLQTPFFIKKRCVSVESRTHDIGYDTNFWIEHLSFGQKL